MDVSAYAEKYLRMCLSKRVRNTCDFLSVSAKKTWNNGSPVATSRRPTCRAEVGPRAG